MLLQKVSDMRLVVAMSIVLLSPAAFAQDARELLNNSFPIDGMSDEFLGRWTVGASCSAEEKSMVYHNRVEAQDSICLFETMLRHQTRPVIFLVLKCKSGDRAFELKESWMFNSQKRRFVRFDLKSAAEKFYWRCRD